MVKRHTNENTNRLIRESFIKNIFLLIISITCYPIIENSFSFVTDKETLNTLVLFVGLIIVVPLFANFSFSYKGISYNSLASQILMHTLAFCLTLTSLLLLEMIDVLFIMAVGKINIFRIVLLLLGISIYTYDFWDTLRVKNQE